VTRWEAGGLLGLGAPMPPRADQVLKLWKQVLEIELGFKYLCYARFIDAKPTMHLEIWCLMTRTCVASLVFNLLPHASFTDELVS
jgi:hypothetical protein